MSRLDCKAYGTIWSLPYAILMIVNLFQSMATFMTNTTLPIFANPRGA